MNIALILSGGTGNRLGAEIPKQYIKVGGRPVIGYCIGCLLKHSRIDALQIVAAPAWQERISEWLAADGWGAGSNGNSGGIRFRERTGSFLFCMGWRIYGNMPKGLTGY